MPTAIQHVFTVPGVVLSMQMSARELQQVTTKFWGVDGESRISGGLAGRMIEVPVIVYGDQFSTRAKLADWFDDLEDFQGKTGTLRITSSVNRPAIKDVSFDSAIMVTDPKIDEAGSLGGSAWAIVRFLFRQHS